MLTNVTTISDVARAAGVSTATVSRALNRHATVDPALAARVLEAAETLGYRPNALARSLRQKKTSVWALIISDIGNPFFTAIARGVEDVAQQNGFSVILCNADEDAGKESQYLGVAQQEQVAGVILSPHSSTTDTSSLVGASIPLVAIDRKLDQPVDTVLVNSREGARAATSHLLDEGWTRPACITGPLDADTAVQRQQGYDDALAARGLSAQSMVRRDVFRQEAGRAAAASLLDAPVAPDAFFVANSNLALGALAECAARGIRIGTDVGLIAFDDAPWAQFIDPPISVVTQPAYEIGAKAARLLVERIAGRRTVAPEDTVLPTELILRASSRRGVRSTQ